MLPTLTSIVVFSAAALSAGQEAPVLLPKLPADWRFERLELPLTFAPDLGYEGFEELAFAPGMFAPESDTYFSYALALRLKGAVAFDDVTLQRLLMEYYRGLCAAVAESRQLALDLDKVRVDVRRKGADYHATIEMYDAFVTGQPMTLALELAVVPLPRATLLFGLASPMPKAGAAWTALRALREEWRAMTAMPVFLNHLYVVPDAATYAALRDSEFLRQVFAVGETRTTVRRDQSYTGTYFYGARTYFEFLAPDPTTPYTEGSCGLAFGIERAGGTARCVDALKQRGIDTFAGPITRQLGDVEVPWFKIMGVAMPESRLALFSLEYDPRFLATWHADLPPAAGGIRRSDVLARYRAVLDGPKQPLLEDVEEVYLDLGDAERERFLAVCESFDYERDDGDLTVVHGPEVRFVLHAVPGPARITGFRMRLREPVERDSVGLGSARLDFDGRHATLWLE